MTHGIIKADGSVQFFGYDKMDCRVLDVRNGYITLHHAGGTYSDNGGAHYVPARVEVDVLDYLKPGNEEGTWLFGLGRRSLSKFHPTPKEACRIAMANMPRAYERLQAEKERVCKP